MLNRYNPLRTRRILSSDTRFLIVVLAPIVLLIALFIYYPALNTFGTSQTNYNLRIHKRKEPKPVGFNNYVKLVEDEEFWEVTGRSFKVVLITLPLELAVAFAIAMLLNQRFPGRGVVRTLTILPWMLPGVVNGFLWGWLLNGEFGALNGFLYQLGLISEYKYWLRDPEHLIFWVTVVQTWTRYAFPTIILLAGLQSIPEDLYDAAKVDGASAISRVRFITVPLLLPSFGIALVVEFIAAFQIFDVIWTLTAGGSAGGAMNPFTKTLMLYNYELVFRDLKVGMGAALSYIILLMSLAVGLIFVMRVYNQGVQEQ